MLLEAFLILIIPIEIQRTEMQTDCFVLIPVGFGRASFESYNQTSSIPAKDSRKHLQIFRKNLIVDFLGLFSDFLCTRAI